MKHLHLQGIGNHKAIEAKELKSGMVTVWNYGYKSVVKDVVFSKSGKTLIALIENEQGKLFERKMKSSRLVAVEQ